MISINPDAHSTSEIKLIHWGVEMARKGGVPKGRVLNCLELANFSAYLNQKRSNTCAGTLHESLYPRLLQFCAPDG